MDDLNVSLSPQPANIDMTTPSSPPVKKSPWILILSLFLIVAIAFAGYFYWQNTLLRVTSTVTFAPSPTATTTVDPTANWQTYSSKKYKFTFKYPPTWVLKDVSVSGYDDQIWLAQSVSLLPQGLPGQIGNGATAPITFIISQKNLSNSYQESQYIDYQSQDYKIGNLEGIKISGISKEGQTKETIISAKMNTQYLNVIPLIIIEDQFLDQILSTFQFTPSENSQSNILDDILEMTKPMVWSKPVAGSLSDGMGKEVSGTLITAQVGSKSDNKLAQYLVTDTPIVNKYGWEETLTADGVGESLIIYSKNGQQLIIRMQNGQYNILLSN